MKQFWMIAGLIASLILAGCGQSTFDLYERDWCYIFDFTQNQQGFLISSGTLISQGIASDSSGLLQTSYGYDRDVYPNIVQVTVVRPSGITGDIQATAAGMVFGVSTYFTATMPADLNLAQLTFTPSTEGVEYIGDRNAINITVDGSQPIALESIFVGGMGASPFPHNLCDDSTPTPVITDSGTGTPFTTTPSPSPTPTGTWESPTPSPTMDGAWCQTWDFLIESGSPDITGGVEGYATGVWTEGVGWQGTTESDMDRNWITTTLPSAVFVGIASFSWSTVSDYAAANWWLGNADFGIPVSMTDGQTTAYRTFDTTVSELWLGIERSGFSLTPVANLTSLTIQGNGTDPGFTSGESCTPAPTATPGPSNTPWPSPTMGPTNTPEPLWSSCIDFTANQYFFEGIDATYTDGLGWLQEAGEFSVGRAGVGLGAKKKVKFVFDGTWAGSVRARLPSGASMTGWHLGVGPEFVVDFSAESWIPSQNVFFDFDGSYAPYFLEKICWLDPNPSTGTPIPGTGTPIGTRTPLPTVTGTIPPSRTPVLVPNPPVIIITATNGVWITSTPLYGGTGVYNPTGTTSPLITGTPGGEGTPGGDGSGGTGYGSGGGGFGDIGDMIGFGWNIGWGLFGALIAYLGQATSIVTGLLTAFTNATPQPIPGLPMCITNPMAHDLCALWYIMDNTFFAPATPGQYIVPLLQILFNVVIAIYFVRWVLKIIWRGEAVTHVE